MVLSISTPKTKSIGTLGSPEVWLDNCNKVISLGLKPKSPAFNSNSKKLNLAEVKNLSFEEPDFERFPCLKYAFDAGKVGGSMGAVLNAANEIAVYAFLDDKIKFLDISKIIKRAIENHKIIKI